MTRISAVVPCYNEEASIPLFMNSFLATARDMRTKHQDLCFEVLFVDDGSGDKTLETIRQLAANNPEYSDEGLEVRWLSFSRNFGKEAALYAGLFYARGEYVATMDADMQDPPAPCRDVRGASF